MNENDKRAKPVGQVTSGMQQNGSQCFKPYSDDAPPIGAEIYATAQPVQPAAAINEHLLEALKNVVKFSLMYRLEESDCCAVDARAAIAEAEKAKGGAA